MTLLEVMIAVTLFAILSVGIFTALRIGLSAMGHVDERLMSNRRAAYAARIVESELNGLMPEWAVFRPSPQSPLQMMPFFQGEVQNMRFVSTYSLQDSYRGMPQILEFTVIPGEQRGVRLIVNERPFTGVYSTGALCLGFGKDPLTAFPVPVFQPIVAGPTSFVLADKLASCRFLFETPPLIKTPAMWVEHWIRRIGPSPSASRWTRSIPTPTVCSPCP